MKLARWTLAWTVLSLAASCQRSEPNRSEVRVQADAARQPASAPPAAPSVPAPAASVPAANPAGHPGRIEHVVMITVDGLGGRYLDELVPAGELPTFRRLQQSGAWTHNARTETTHAATLPNHIAMLTGRPVAATPGMPTTAHHGYTQNIHPAPDDTLHASGNPAVDYVASVFDVVHDHGRKTCLYAGKSKFVIFEQSYDEEHGAPDQVGEDNGPTKLDEVLVTAQTERLVQALIGEMRDDPCHFAFLLIADTDSTGHREGWGSTDWKRVLQQADTWIGQIWDVLQNQARLRGRSALIVLADHGGQGTSHGNATNRWNYTIPFYVWGPGVPSGQNLYAVVNDTRTDPGDTQPAYTAPVKPIRTSDAGNLALELLGLPSIPGSVIRGMNLLPAR